MIWLSILSTEHLLAGSFYQVFYQKNEHKEIRKILNRASIASKAPGPWQSVYHGTKAFILSFTEAIRQEVKDRNVIVTALLPGAADTDFFNKAGLGESKIVNRIKMQCPIQKM